MSLAKAVVLMLLRFAGAILSVLLYGLVVLPAGFVMLLAYLCVFLGIAALVIAALTKGFAPQVQVFPEIEAAGVMFCGAAVIYVVVPAAVLLCLRLQGAMARWTGGQSVPVFPPRNDARFGG